MIEKTKWVIESPHFGKRRIWKDGIGPFFVVHNMHHRNCPGDDFEIYEAERVTDIHDDNIPIPNSEGSTQ